VGAQPFAPPDFNHCPELLKGSDSSTEGLTVAGVGSVDVELGVFVDTGRL